MVSVLIADDHEIVREGLRRLLDREMDLEVCGEAGDGREVLEKIEQLRPDVVVLDINMPLLAGFEVLERVRALPGDVKVVLLSMHSDPPYVRNAISLGADAYVVKNTRADEVIMAVRAVVRGDSYFSPPIARLIAQELRSNARAGSSFFELSTREREVLQLIAEGYSAKEIASDIHVSVKTVESHRSNLMRKLGARKATDLVRHAVRRGFVSP